VTGAADGYARMAASPRSRCCTSAAASQQHREPAQRRPGQQPDGEHRRRQRHLPPAELLRARADQRPPRRSRPARLALDAGGPQRQRTRRARAQAAQQAARAPQDLYADRPDRLPVGSGACATRPLSPPERLQVARETIEEVAALLANGKKTGCCSAAMHCTARARTGRPSRGAHWRRPARRDVGRAPGRGEGRVPCASCPTCASMPPSSCRAMSS